MYTRSSHEGAGAGDLKGTVVQYWKGCEGNVELRKCRCKTGEVQSQVWEGFAVTAGEASRDLPRSLKWKGSVKGEDRVLGKMRREL